MTIPDATTLSDSFGRCALAWMLAVCVGIGLAPNADAQTRGEGMAHTGCGAPSSPSRPRIGLALGGGGARGIAHLSVLRMLEQQRVPIDCIAGTSMGALVGGLYASGMSVDDMEQLLASSDWKQLFDDSLSRPERSFRRKQDDRDGLATVGVGISRTSLKLSPGMLQGQRILAMFENSTLRASAVTDFDRLHIPFRAVATDLNSGHAVVLDHGSLALAMRASMSLPGIFQPVEIEGRVLLDGGLVNQVPIDVVRAMGADVVIAVDVGTPMANLQGDASLLDVVSQISGMMTTGNTRRQLDTLGSADILITPDLGTDVKTGDFTKVAIALEIGERAAEGARARIAELAVPDRDYEKHLEARPSLPGSAPVVEFVRVENHTRYADEVLLAGLKILVGEPLDTARIERELLRAYSMGTLSSVTYEVTTEDGRTGVLIQARPKPQGPNYLQLGLTLNTDFEGSFESNLRAAVLFAPLTPYGAEARVTVAVGSEPGLKGELYFPLDAGNRNLLYGRIEYENPNIHVFDRQGRNTSTYDVRAGGLTMKAAREFGNHGALSIGVQRMRGKARVEVGDPANQGFDFDQGEAFVSLAIDRLDSLYFPRDGYYGQLGYTASREALGSDSQFNQMDVDALFAASFGNHALQLGASYHTTLSGELPIQSRYRLGGRARLSGYRLNELTGQHYALVLAGYSYQLASFMGRSALLGGTLEYGNAWERRQDMALDDGVFNASVYAGFDSWLGPMLLGIGWRERGSGILFLEVGRPF
ncbi:NTE family protein [Pseudoxanthomonas sp. 3HH-4]|uniref:patatin-like phospholipase family protein n=1 Tax=Pseudoxanthomonas sp. 3HH-4 TaxID=1690214 RepID=UPI001151E2F0|nr:patatin-like phospholipase family protein [Pseudoxanthomonas sp. 3HH-4]TQM12114.1 NTE family protein [Pseudoxanthomonas sp. 3HH-4]